MKESKKPKVSAIITAYNRPRLVKNAIGSVVNQSYENIECIVVDDCSSDEGVVEAYKSFEGCGVSHYRHSTNKGLSAARNTGIERASGKYIAFLDDDDTWRREKIERQVECFENLGSEFAMVYCWMNYVDNEDQEVVREYKPEYRGYIFPETLDGQPIGAGSTLLVRTSVAAEVNGFDVSLPRGIDGDFIRRVCRKYKVDYVPKILVDYRINHGGERITSEDVEGLKDAIAGHKSKLYKFRNDLEEMPKKYSIINSKIGFLYAKTGNFSESIKHNMWALASSPYERDIYKNIYKSLKNLTFK
jgi:glycosyltransferase involved in cell wall biosynthesis